MVNSHAVLLVDDEPENLRALERTLRSHFPTVTCESATEALQKLEKQSFAVIISDQRMPQMVGTEFLSRAATKYPLTTRIILTAYTDSQNMLDAINRAEIYRYITKPWKNEELISAVSQGVERHRLLSENRSLIEALESKNRRLEEKEKELTDLNRSLEKLVEQRTVELRTANERLSELAMTDPLTKIHNRRSFMAKFQEELERSKRYRHAITLAMIDVDHFKKFNDSEGHPCGDEALRKIAQIFTSKLRKTDVLGRYGGEEFIVMMPETKLSVGAEICDRLRSAVDGEAFQGQKQAMFMTVSLGCAGYPEHGTTSAELIKAADHALYQAKQIGRNRVVTEE